MSNSRRIVAALVAGIACGLFLGEEVAPLKVVADGFVKLLQMTVLPYVTLSIVSSLGSLEYADARRLGIRAGAVILGLWTIAIGFAFVMPLCFPAMESASFFSTTMVERREDFDFIDLYIPANPFRALASNIVPAVVLFSFILGIALIGVPQRQKLLDVLKVSMEAVSRATKFVVRLTPLGIFAISANAAGTLSVTQAGQIQIYLISYVTIALLLAFWILPGLVWALTPLPMREVFQPNRDALLTAFIAGDLFIVLPALTETSVQTLKRMNLTTRDQYRLPETIVPASFNFPHTGKLLSLSFILFAGWFADADVGLGSYPRLAAAGLMSFFGQLSAAVPFLLDLFRIPVDTNQLFMATGVINSRFGTLLAGVHTVVVALLGSAAIAGIVRFQPARLLRYALVSLLLTAGTLGGLRLLFSTVLKPKFEGAEVLNRMEPLTNHEPSIVLKDEPDGEEPTGSVISGIQARGILRVGFFPNRSPYAFFNGNGHLVGFDIELAHSLARELGVQPRFIPLATADLAEAMNSGRCDIIMSAALPTPRRAIETLFSQAYLDETLSFCVKDYRRQEFATWAEVRSLRSLKVAVMNLPHYLLLAESLLPTATIVPVDPDDLKLDEKSDFDAYIVPAERGSIQALLHPSFSVVVPQPGVIRFPVAYPLARHDRQWAEIVDTWIEGERKAGNIDKLYAHWILGQSAESAGKRWSILKDVLHWGAPPTPSIKGRAKTAP